MEIHTSGAYQQMPDAWNRNKNFGEVSIDCKDEGGELKQTAHNRETCFNTCRSTMR